MGFEPTNNGFAIRPLGPLGYAAGNSLRSLGRSGGAKPRTVRPMQVGIYIGFQQSEQAVVYRWPRQVGFVQGERFVERASAPTEVCGRR